MARQREDLVLLAHLRSAFPLSHETYGNPRMTDELLEQGLAAGLQLRLLGLRVALLVQWLRRMVQGIGLRRRGCRWRVWSRRKVWRAGCARRCSV